MFLAGLIFGALSCFARADYNLPLYAFLYLMWDQDDVSNDYVIYGVQNDKLKLLLLLTLTLFGDLIWMFYWVPFWWSSEMARWQLGLHNFVIFCSFSNLVLKLIIMGTLVTVKENDLRNAAGRLRNWS